MEKTEEKKKTPQEVLADINQLVDIRLEEKQKTHNFLEIGDLKLTSHDLKTQDLAGLGVTLLKEPIIQKYLEIVKEDKMKGAPSYVGE